MAPSSLVSGRRMPRPPGTGVGSYCSRARRPCYVAACRAERAGGCVGVPRGRPCDDRRRRRCSGNGAMLIFELAVVGALILLNGFFAMSELAVVSSRRGRLQQMAQNGNKGARSALRLVEDTTGFLSHVKVGITLAGVLAGAYSGATLSEPLADVFRGLGMAGPADKLAFAIVVAAITYLSLIVGELVPKRLAMNNAEGIAASVAPVLSFLARAEIGRAHV